MGDTNINKNLSLIMKDPDSCQIVDCATLVRIENKPEEKEQEQNTVLEAAQRAAKAVGGLFSLWISQALVAEAFGAATAYAASTAAAGAAVSGAGFVVCATAAAATGKLGIDLISGKSLEESFEDTASTAKVVSKKIFGFITSPMQTVKETFSKPALPVEHQMKLLMTAA